MPHPTPPVQHAAAATPDARELLAENQQLRRSLRALLGEAQQNEQKMARFQALELRLMGCNSLADLLRTLIYDYRVAAGLDRVTLLLLDPEYEMRRILDDDGVDVANNPDLLFSDRAELTSAHPALAQVPYLGPFRRELHANLFPTRPLEPQSIALLPLLRRGVAVGTLNLGSTRPERFVAGSASDFLERFAAVVAMCSENATNHERLKRIGHTDTLTNVANRRLFDQRLYEEVARTQRQGVALSCLFFDVDFFKKVNDIHGHAAGDLVLREIALVIKDGLRATDVLARYGGEEFAVLLPGSDVRRSGEIAERIRHAVGAHVFRLTGGTALNVTVSVGAATLEPARNEGPASRLGRGLLELADAGVYQAKAAGRNNVQHLGAVATGAARAQNTAPETTNG